MQEQFITTNELFSKIKKTYKIVDGIVKSPGHMYIGVDSVYNTPTLRHLTGVKIFDVLPLGQDIYFADGRRDTVAKTDLDYVYNALDQAEDGSEFKLFGSLDNKDHYLKVDTNKWEHIMYSDD